MEGMESILAPFIILGFVCVSAPLVLLNLVGRWRMFVKAGKPGWASLIPIYSSWCIFTMVGIPGWVALLLLVPLVNFFVVPLALFAWFRLPSVFGRSFLLGPLNVLTAGCLAHFVLGFGDARYQGPLSRPRQP